MEQGEQAAPPRPVGGLHRVLGIVGRVMITLGLLIIAFVGYQLWGTGIEFRAHQRALEDEFDVTQSSLLATTTAPSTVAPTTAAPTTSTSTVPGASTIVTTSTTTTTSTVPTPTLPPISLGDPVGKLRMPSISDKAYFIVAGVRVEDLQAGVGHYPSTPLPGQYGNAALAGHRTTYGAVFGDLDDLKVGDRLIVDTLLGEHYEYVVQGSEIIKPSETRVLSQPDDPTQATLTLTTCHPKKSTKKRLIIHSVLDPAASSPLERPMFNYQTASTAAGEPTTVPELAGEDNETTVAPTSAPATTAPGTTVSAASATTARAVTTIPPATTAIVIATTAAPALAGEDVVLQDADNLGRGWFHDGRAWPHVIFWGGLLSLIAYGAWRLGKLVGHGWVAYVAGFVPFVLVLYFFFQNVNRLLPPGL